MGCDVQLVIVRSRVAVCSIGLPACGGAASSAAAEDKGKPSNYECVFTHDALCCCPSKQTGIGLNRPGVTAPLVLNCFKSSRLCRNLQEQELFAVITRKVLVFMRVMSWEIIVFFVSAIRYHRNQLTMNISNFCYELLNADSLLFFFGQRKKKKKRSLKLPPETRSYFLRVIRLSPPVLLDAVSCKRGWP